MRHMLQFCNCRRIKGGTGRIHKEEVQHQVQCQIRHQTFRPPKHGWMDGTKGAMEDIVGPTVISWIQPPIAVQPAGRLNRDQDTSPKQLGTTPWGVTSMENPKNEKKGRLVFVTVQYMLRNSTKLPIAYSIPTKNEGIRTGCATADRHLHCLCNDSPSENYRASLFGIRATQPDGMQVRSHVECNLKIKSMPAGARKTYKFEQLADNSLISLPILADNNCTILLDKTKIIVQQEGKIIMKGHKGKINGIMENSVRRRASKWWSER